MRSYVLWLANGYIGQDEGCDDKSHRKGVEGRMKMIPVSPSAQIYPSNQQSYNGRRRRN